MTGPALVMVAPNGARRGKADHPALPVTIADTARCAAACFLAGAGAIHAHVRDADGRHVLDAGLYRALIAEIAARAGPEMAVQITTEAVGRYTPAEQRAVVEAVRPEAVSVALREMMPDPQSEAAGLGFYADCARENIAVQHILYDTGDLDRLLALRRSGKLPEGTLSLLIVLGRYAAGQESEAGALLPFLGALEAAGDREIAATVCAFGRGETAALAAALALGLHARVGFENSLAAPDGSVPADNAQSVARIAGIARALGRARPGRAETLRLLGARLS